MPKENLNKLIGASEKGQTEVPDPHTISINNVNLLNVDLTDPQTAKEFYTHAITPQGFIDVTIGNQQIHSKLDSGADLNIISENTLNALPQHLKQRFKPDRYAVKTAAGHFGLTLGTIRLRIAIQNQYFSVKFTVLRNAEFPIFLGKPFHRNYQCMVDHGRDNITLSDAIPIHSTCSFKMSPMEEVIVAGRLHIQLPDNTEGFSFYNSNLNDKGIWAAHCMQSVQQSLVPMRLVNSTMADVDIKANEKIGTFRIRTKDDEISSFARPKPLTNCHPGANMTIPSVCSVTTDNEPSSPDANKPSSPSTPNDNPDKDHTKACDDKTLSDTKHQQVSPTDPQTEIPYDKDFKVDLSKSKLTHAQKEKLRRLLYKYKECFVDASTGEIGLTDLVSCKIELKPGSIPCTKYPYRMNPSEREALTEILEDLEAKGYIEETFTGAWASPVLLVKKASGGHRVVIDFRYLNSCTIPQVLRVPVLAEILDYVGTAKPEYFSVLDCTSGFFQVPLEESSRDFTAFISGTTKYRWRRMPQGFRNSPAVFQSLLDLVLKGCQYVHALSYIDDVIIYSSTFEQHLVHLEDVLSRLQKAGLKLSAKKCVFAADEVKFLGHNLSKRGISPCADKIEIVQQFPVPTKVKEVRSFLGLVGYYRRFVKDFARIARPLYNLTKKNLVFKWDESCQKAFESLRDAITSDNVLKYPDFKKPFFLTTDACNTGIGCCLSQEYDGVQHPIAFAGRGFSGAELNWDTTDQELYGVVFGIAHFRVYLSGAPFHLRTDHSALKEIISKKSMGEMSKKKARWIEFLSRYDFDVTHLKGKDNVVADGLSRMPHEVTRTVTDDYIENYNDLSLFSEEDSNTVETHESIKVSPATADMPSKVISKHSVEQDCPTISALAKTIVKARKARFRQQLQKAADVNVDEMTITPDVVKKEQWRDPKTRVLINKLKYDRLPDDAQQARQVLQKEDDYLMINGMLYRIYIPPTMKESKAIPQLVVPQNLKKKLLKMHHDDILSGHIGVKRMIYVMKKRYHWSGMIKSIQSYVAQCESCSRSKAANVKFDTPMSLRDPSPSAFHTICIDTMGEFNRTRRGNRHIVVCNDLYSKFVVSWPTPDITAKSIAAQLYYRVCCVFGFPRRILSDNGSAFASNIMKEMCKQFNIHQSFSTSYHSQSQGITERSNRSLVNLMRNYVNAQQTDWDMKIQPLVWALNTSESTPTGMSAYKLLFGRQPLCMSEVHIPQPLQDSYTVQDHYQDIVRTQLECHAYVQKHMQKYNAEMKARYDSKLTNQRLEVGDTVYVYQPKLEVPHTRKKLQKSYHGPYTLTKFVNTKCVQLMRSVDNEYLEKPISITRLKKGHPRQPVNDWDPMVFNDADGPLLADDDLPADSFVTPTVVQQAAPLTKDQPDLPVNDDTVPSTSDGIRRSTRSSKGQKQKDPNFSY